VVNRRLINRQGGCRRRHFTSREFRLYPHENKGTISARSLLELWPQRSPYQDKGMVIKKALPTTLLLMYLLPHIGAGPRAPSLAAKGSSGLPLLRGRARSILFGRGDGDPSRNVECGQGAAAATNSKITAEMTIQPGICGRAGCGCVGFPARLRGGIASASLSEDEDGEEDESSSMLPVSPIPAGGLAKVRGLGDGAVQSPTASKKLAVSTRSTKTLKRNTEVRPSIRDEDRGGDLEFQLLDLDYKKGNGISGKFTIDAFGVTERGNSVHLSVVGFQPYFFINVTKALSEEECGVFVRRLNHKINTQPQHIHNNNNQVGCAVDLSAMP
jgi:hypothetical protein